MADRIDFEELALKGVNPSMGPKISQPRNPGEEQTKAVLVFIIVSVGPSQLNTPPELDPSCPSSNYWQAALGSLRGDPYKTHAKTSQGILHVDAIGTVDCTVHDSPYVSSCIHLASPIYPVYSCDTQSPVFLLCMAIMVAL